MLDRFRIIGDCRLDLIGVPPHPAAAEVGLCKLRAGELAELDEAIAGLPALLHVRGGIHAQTIVRTGLRCSRLFLLDTLDITLNGIANAQGAGVLLVDLDRFAGIGQRLRQLALPAKHLCLVGEGERELRLDTNGFAEVPQRVRQIVVAVEVQRAPVIVSHVVIRIVLDRFRIVGDRRLGLIGIPLHPAAAEIGACKLGARELAELDEAITGLATRLEFRGVIHAQLMVCTRLRRLRRRHRLRPLSGRRRRLAGNEQQHEHRERCTLRPDESGAAIPGVVGPECLVEPYKPSQPFVHSEHHLAARASLRSRQ